MNVLSCRPPTAAPLAPKSRPMGRQLADDGAAVGRRSLLTGAGPLYTTNSKLNIEERLQQRPKPTNDRAA
ncbi:MAG: hypothetical protein ACOCN7_07955 [Prevotella sp.]